MSPIGPLRSGVVLILYWFAVNVTVLGEASAIGSERRDLGRLKWGRSGRPVFARLFDRDALLLEARRLGAVKRDRTLYVWDVLLARVRCAANLVQRRSVAKALGVHVRDVRVIDASVVTLPGRAMAHYPSSHSCCTRASVISP
jgi:hypothetical protein